MPVRQPPLSRNDRARSRPQARAPHGAETQTRCARRGDARAPSGAHRATVMSVASASIGTVHPAVGSMMRRAIDYAGLFPPASLDMHAAVEEYHRQSTSADAWML